MHTVGEISCELTTPSSFWQLSLCLSLQLLDRFYEDHNKIVSNFTSKSFDASLKSRSEVWLLDCHQ
jgi:hypothetical protein